MSRYKKSAGIAVVATSLVAGAEGLRQQAYLDPVGIPTICFGETKGVHMGDVKTKEECKAMLSDRLDGFSQEMDKYLTNSNVPDKSYAAFLSWFYNIGAGKAKNSTLFKKANAGDIAGACDELLKWDNPKWLPGIRVRRENERNLCYEGIYEMKGKQNVVLD